MTNTAKGLRSPPPDPDLPRSPPIDLAARAGEELQRVKWLLWHGNALPRPASHRRPRDRPRHRGPRTGAAQAAQGPHRVRDVHLRERGLDPELRRAYRAGEAISSSLAESAVNEIVSKRMVKKQQMRWSQRGAHLLLQIRTRVLNDDLADDFHRWYPGFTHTPAKEKIAA